MLLYGRTQRRSSDPTRLAQSSATDPGAFHNPARSIFSSSLKGRCAHQGVRRYRWRRGAIDSAPFSLLADAVRQDADRPSRDAPPPCHSTDVRHERCAPAAKVRSADQQRKALPVTSCKFDHHIVGRKWRPALADRVDHRAPRSIVANR
jgi:hypothetical protein